MKSTAILYVPSDSPEVMTMATRRVAGVPMILRGVMTLAQAGVEKCTLLIAKTQHPKIERFLGRCREVRLPEIDVVYYDESYGVGPEAVGSVAEKMDERCMFINANLLFEKQLVYAMQGAHIADGEMVLCREGAHTLPIYEISRSSWLTLEAFTSARPRSIESCLRNLIESSSIKHAAKPSETSTFLLTHPRDRAVAEKSLCETIRHRIDGPIAKYINKRISLPVSLLLSKLWISPNTITAVNIIIGVFCGAFVADGHRYHVILFGAFLFQLASIVDGCDGEVAKLTFRCSKFGQYADTLCDNLSLGSFMTGLIAGYWRHTHSYIAYAAGAVMVSTTAITFFWMVRYLKRNTDSASLVTFDKQYLQKLTGQPRWLLALIKYGKYTLKKDVFSFMFLCFAIAGELYLLLFLTAIGTTVAACVLTYLGVRDILALSRGKECAGVSVGQEG